MQAKYLIPVLAHHPAEVDEAVVNKQLVFNLHNDLIVHCKHLHWFFHCGDLLFAKINRNQILIENNLVQTLIINNVHLKQVLHQAINKLHVRQPKQFPKELVTQHIILQSEQFEADTRSYEYKNFIIKYSYEYV